MADKWCKIIEIRGNQVLITNRYDVDSDEYRMSVTIQATDWIPNSIFGEVKFSLGTSEDAFTSEQLEKFAVFEIIEPIINDKLIPHLINTEMDSDDESMDEGYIL